MFCACASGVFSRQLAVLAFLGRSEQDVVGGALEGGRGREGGGLAQAAEQILWLLLGTAGIGEPVGCSWGTWPVSRAQGCQGLVLGLSTPCGRSPVTGAPWPPCAPLALGTGLGFWTPQLPADPRALMATVRRAIIEVRQP